VIYSATVRRVRNRPEKRLFGEHQEAIVRGAGELNSPEPERLFGFPEDWFYFRKTGKDSGYGGVRCFPSPDPNKLSETILKDRKLFERLLLSMRDLAHARSALTFIREDVDFDKEYPLAELRRFQCYETTVIVSYSRPFSQSTTQIPRLSYERLGIKLSPFTRALHENLIQKRNKIFAHSDADAVEYVPPQVMRFERPHDEPFTILYPPRFREGTLLSRNELEQVSVLVVCLSGAIYEMLHVMHTNFVDEFPPIDDEDS